MPSFSVVFSTTIPGSDVSTRNALIPLAPAPPVRNIAMTTPEYPPLVHHCLRPLSTQPSPSRRAVARIAAASDPASGSVSPKPAITSPAASCSSQRRFCSAEPSFAIALQIIECTETVTAVPASTFASSSIASAYET